MAKLFLGGLAFSTMKEDVEEHFRQYGTVTDSIVMIKDGKHRGFGFVTFAEEEAVEAVLAQQQIIHDRVIDVKRAVPGGEAPPPRHGGGGFGGGCKGGGKGFGGGKGGGGGGHAGPTDKVFVGGLAPTVTDETLTNYFSRYGTLVDVVVMKDRATQKSRGFGFVRYDTTDPVEQVMADYESHQIDGKWVEVKRAVPQEQIAPDPRGKGGFGKGGGCKGGGKGGYGMGGGGGYGAMGGCGGYGGYGGGYGGCGGCGGGYGGYGGGYMNGGCGYNPYMGGGGYGGGMGMDNGMGYKGGAGGGGYRARPY
mmetsp:Transcript_72354/g.150982  ORF Transcript_72354/g.150982 Transcript_72354/m.150982 type:complete len:307 (-) Transcript_72354:71-991(-)|eukprot:CAMPEP_0206456172 /NCGR_PEP_ID=MMETSP0324_2-20121206/22206_1 /ASSEMBLY_ACC=CAM_ASM_000836 /TAXON_ID=2866 /ORGANISM="Crypthecodinium cohnii, Strain Seligo" /LENGTH=306 /DNA_ID=CAMNT_0053927049 /DNA_START=90 /DNA_END=1010 /DNA_ORIENTATION=-